MNGSVWHRRCATRGAALAAMATALVLQVAQPAAAAAEPSATGWWSALGQAATATSPDVPAEGLLVQGGTTETAPAALAAVSYPSLNGTPTLLALEVIGNSTPGAVLQACRLTEAFTPAYGGAMEDAPGFDCTGAVRATVSADGKTQSLEVADLVQDGVLTIALLPTASTDRVVLAKVSAASLSVTPASSSPLGPVAGPTPSAPVEPLSTDQTAPSLGSGMAPVALPPALSPLVPAPAAVPQVAPGVVPEVATPVQTQTLALAQARSSDDGGGDRTGLLAGMMAFLAIGLWLAAGRSAERTLVPVVEAEQ